MDTELIVMALGFLFASYSVVGNDVIQTLGTFLSSNSERKWYFLWAYTAAILIGVLLYGYFMYEGDVSHGRLAKVPEPSYFHWWYALPPLVLLIITRLGVPVSTTFLVLSVFTVGEMEGTLNIFEEGNLIRKMLGKSVLGYILAFTLACIVYALISNTWEKYFIKTEFERKKHKNWIVLQWISTGLLWSQWLIQDLANIYVYLPRGKNLDTPALLLSIFVLVALQGYIFYSKGGAIQKIVTSKTNTLDVRSATIIDFIFAIILIFFKKLSEIPMSTTWVFVGLLAGREFMISYRLKTPALGSVRNLVLSDLGKILAGLLVSVALVYIIYYLR